MSLVERWKRWFKDIISVVVGDVEDLSPERLARAGWLVTGAQLVLAAFVATFLALQTNYFGKPFGTGIQYIGLFVAGFTAQAVLTELFGYLGGLVTRR